MYHQIKLYSFCALISLALALVPQRHAMPKRTMDQAPNQINSRIAGGQELEPHGSPYQAGLFIRTSNVTYFCSGALISYTTVLATATCASLSNDIEVVLGAHRIFEIEEGQLKINASDVIVHPDFNTITLQNDIALIRFSEIMGNEELHKGKIPRRSESFEGPFFISGWGFTEDNGTLSATMQYVLEMYEVENVTECQQYYRTPIDYETQFCFYGAVGESICYGDNGDPIYSDSLRLLVGFASYFSEDGCSVGYPQVGTKIQPYLDWIGNNSDVVIVN